MCEKSKLLYHRFLARLDPVSEARRYHGPGCSARWCKCSRTCRLCVRFHSCTLLPSLASSICLIPTVPQPLASLTDGHTDLNWVQGLCSQNHPLVPFSLLTVREFQTLSIYSMSQQWVHPLTFLQTFNYTFWWDNAEEMTLWYIVVSSVSSNSADLLRHQHNSTHSDKCPNRWQQKWEHPEVKMSK